MDIVLIRHGQKDPKYFPDKDAPLTQEGKAKVDLLKDLLTRLHLSPEIYLTSACEHARQTAERLSDTRPNAVYPIDALTPRIRTNITGGNIWETVIDQAKQAGVDLSQQTIVAVVGHVPRLEWILTSLTSRPVVRRFNRAEAAWVRAASFPDFLQGKGEVYCRLSVVEDDCYCY